MSQLISRSIFSFKVAVVCRTAEQESAFRDSIHPQLNHKQALIQKQVQQCRDTVEWYTCTKNGKAMTKIPTDTKKAPPLGPATFTTGGEALYHVERVLGATVNQGKIWVLVKWLGYKSSDNSWEPITALQGCSAEIKEFYKKFRYVVLPLPSERAEQFH